MENAWCMRCKARKDFGDFVIQKVPTTRGIKYFLKGTCCVCNTKMAATISKEKFISMGGICATNETRDINENKQP